MTVRNPVIIHWAHQMDRAIDFYRGVFGLDVVVDDPVLSVLDLPPIRLLVHAVNATEHERPLPNAGLNVQVDDIDGIVELVIGSGGGLVVIREPEGALRFRVALCVDSEGNGFELRQEVPAS